LTRGGMIKYALSTSFCSHVQKESETGEYRGATRGAVRPWHGYIGNLGDVRGASGYVSRGTGEHVVRR